MRRRSLPSFVLVWLFAGALLAGSAAADSATVSLTDAAGAVDPVVNVGRTLTVSGNVAAPTRLYVRVRPAGGAPCAPSARSDSAEQSYYGSFSGDLLYDTRVEGNFTQKRTGNWSTAGTFQFCIWLAENSSTAVVPITQVITFRNPTGVISATLNPPTLTVGQTGVLTITGTTEAPSEVYALYKPAGAACAVSYRADSGTGVLNGRNVSGTFSLPESFKVSTAGAYTLCLYLARSSDDPAPVAVQSIPFTVNAPCVVPDIERGASLATLKAALSKTSCVLGTQTLKPDARAPRGTVIGLWPYGGETRAPGTAINVTISDGKRCRVPSSAAGLRLATARSRLSSAGCKSGSVVRVRSGRKVGTVVRFAPGAGTTLAPRAKVTIYVSRGRR